MTDQPGFIPSEDRGARLLKAIEQHLYTANLLAFYANVDQDREVRELIEDRLFPDDEEWK